MKNLILRYTLGKLCVLLLLFTGVYVWLCCLPEASRKEEALGQVLRGKDRILAAGTVACIEEKQNSHQQTQRIISLHSVTFRNKTFQTDKQQTADGILCYLAEGETIPLYGQRVIVSGRASCFSKSRNPGEFDAARYYQAKGAEFYLEDAVIEHRESGYDRLRQSLYELRGRLKQQLLKVCGEDAGVMCSLLLGDKELLLPETKKLYQGAGISHILAISGLHISFFGAGLYRLLRICLPVCAAGTLSGATLLLYVLMTGASPSASRAGGMFLLCLLADAQGRTYDRRTALFFCCAMQALQDPRVLLQSGFYLSYGAVLGLEMLLPVLQDLGRIKGYRLLAPGLSVFFITFPVLLISYYEFPIFSFFLNLAVIPLMSGVMTFGLLSLAAGFAYLPLGCLLFFPAHLILRLFETGCRLCIYLPGNQWIAGKPPVWRLLLYFVLLLLFCMLGRFMAKAEACLFLAGAVWILSGMSPVRGSITFLDVGQGDGIIVQDKKGNTVMIDGGSSSESGLYEYTLLPYLKSQGIDRLDCVFVSHTDEDHVSALRELLKEKCREIKVGTLILPYLSSPDETYEEIVYLAREAGIRVGFMKRGDVWRQGDMCYRCLHPRKGEVYADKNEASLVLHMQMTEMTALFTGDLDGEMQQRFAETYPKALGGVDVLKAGHHGSKASCSQELLEKVCPAHTVISCGENNRYGHPAKETLRRLAEKNSRVYITAVCGAVRAEAGRSGSFRWWLKWKGHTW